MSVGVERLSWPKEQNREEVRSRDEGNDEGKEQDSRLFRNGSWEHGIRCKLPLIDAKRSEECKTDKHRCQDVSTTPRILVTTPLYASHEEKKTGDGQEATNQVDTLEHFATGHADSQFSWRRVVKDCSQYKTNKGPYTAEEADVSPCTSRCN